MCEIRDYRPGDEDDVLRIVSAVLAEYGLSANPEATDADLADIDKHYLSNNGVFRIVVSGDRVVGSYGLYATAATSCELRKMYLLPEYRGLGLGRRMMEDAFREAASRGFLEMTLETNSRLKEALALYRAWGFREYTPVHLSDRCDLAMRRPIPSRGTVAEKGRGDR